MSTNYNLLSKGLKRLSLLLLLLIISPITLTIAFKALTNFEDSIWIAYVILTLAVLLIIVTITLAFNVFKTLLDALFNKN